MGIVDSQSVKTIEKQGVIGFDGGNKMQGRKRHILVDYLRGIKMVLEAHR